MLATSLMHLIPRRSKEKKGFEKLQFKTLANKSKDVGSKQNSRFDPVFGHRAAVLKTSQLLTANMPQLLQDR